MFLLLSVIIDAVNTRMIGQLPTVNGYDNVHDVYEDYYFFSGHSSSHNHYKEDRQFKWNFEQPYSDGNSFICGGNAAITLSQSPHNNNNEDRAWDFGCELKEHWMLTDCFWSDYRNEFDTVVFTYLCPNDGGIRRYHSNYYEDRRWKFQVESNIYEYPEMTCTDDTDYKYDMDAIHDYNTRAEYFLNGLQHNTHSKWRYCKPNAVTDAITTTSYLSKTTYDETWTKSCDDISDGNAAIVGARSVHDNEYDDTQWIFECGELDTSTYRLVLCGYTGYVNGYGDFNCPRNGVIRSILSTQSNNKENRLWQFECCDIAMADNIEDIVSEDGYYMRYLIDQAGFVNVVVVLLIKWCINCVYFTIKGYQ